MVEEFSECMQGLPPKTFCTEAASLEEVLPICDFLYVTRVQKERLADKALEGESIRVTAELLRKHAKPTLKVSLFFTKQFSSWRGEDVESRQSKAADLYF